MIKKAKLIPIVLLSFACVSATVASVGYYINIEERNALRNPILTLDANDPDASFSTGDRKISKTVRNGTPWKTYKNNMPTPTKSGYDILGWEYSTNGVDFTPVNDELIFTQNAYLRVTAWGATSKDHFSTDSWATIVDIAKGGLPALKDAYWSDIAGYGGTFVIQDYSNEAEVAAKTRTVYLKGMGEYKVRVIGEDQDEIYGEPNKVASLTFEFNEIVAPSIGFSMGDDNNNWDDSYLKYFLQNSFIYRLPEPINDENILKTVSKKTYNQNTERVEETPNTLFIPSLSELGYTYMREDEVRQPDQDRPGCENIACFDEGSPYSFYLANNNKARVKHLVSGETASYWTRSPFSKDVDDWYADITSSTLKLYKGVHVIDENAVVPGMANVSLAGTGNYNPSLVRANLAVNGVSPCFCIGEDTAYKLTVNVEEGTNIIAKHSNYIANNLDAKIQLTDLRDHSAPVIYTNPIEDDPDELYKNIHITMDGETIPTSAFVEGKTTYNNYTYDRKTGLLSINIDKEYLPLNNEVVVNIKKSDSSDSTFEDASWDEIISVAESGYDALKSKFESSYNANGQTFLGLKHEVTINYSDSYAPTVLVRVVGENHDEIADGSGKAALTFQFTQGYKFNSSADATRIAGIESEFDMPDNYNIHYFLEWDWGANLHTRIDVDRFPSLVQPIKWLLENGKLASAAKTVKKTVVNCENTQPVLTEFNAQFFAPSYVELVGENSLTFEGEGTQYEYYIGTNDAAHRFLSSDGYSDTYAISANYTRRSGRYYGWTRSIARQTMEEKLDGNVARLIAMNGLTGSTYLVKGWSDATASIIPCFCLGVESVTP